MSRPLLFRFLAVLFGLALLALVEGMLWLLPEPTDDPFLDLAAFTLFSRARGANGEEVYTISHPYAYPERGVHFAAEKPPETVRIFVLGASAAAGWPHPPEETFTAYLEQRLQAGSGQTVEVINAAAHGFPSYRVARVFAEVVDLGPDAIVLYCGNNEFLEARQYGRQAASRMAEWLDRSQLVRRSRRLLPSRERLAGDELNDLAASMWAKVQRRATELRSDPAQYATVQNHYATSLRSMVQLGAERGVPLLLLTVPSNLRDWLPTVSTAPPKAQEEAWRGAFEAARGALSRQELETARRQFEAALQYAPDHAETWFWLGRSFEALDEIDAARSAFRRARDEDRNPFRAVGPFQDTLRELATQAGLGSIDLVDLERDLDGISKGAAPGFDLFLDYVHPTVEGNHAIAQRVGEVLATRLGLGLGPSRPSTYREAEDFHLQMKALGMALVNHQYVAAVARAGQVEALAAAQAVAPPPVVGEVLEVFSEVLRIERRRLLGRALEPGEAEAAERARRDFYAKWFRYGEF